MLVYKYKYRYYFYDGKMTSLILIIIQQQGKDTFFPFLENNRRNDCIIY